MKIYTRDDAPKTESTPVSDSSALKDLGGQKEPSIDITPIPSNVKSKTVICPYCQREFDLKDVKFRAQNTVTEDEASVNEFFVERANEVFLNFWKNDMCWGDSLMLREFDHDYSVMSAGYDKGTLVASVKFCLLDAEHIREFHTNSDGFLTEVTDTRGVRTDKRVCPHCLSLLPVNYGKGDIYFFSIVGVKGSGKTVFLSKFFEKAFAFFNLADFNAYQTPTAARFIEEKNLSEGKELFDGTSTEYIFPPVFIDLHRNGRIQTLVFYDIAGENCLPKANIAELGKFIRNSAGTIMLISPKQIPNLENIGDDDATVDNTDITSVFSAIAGTFGEAAAEQTKRNGLWGLFPIKSGRRCPLRLAVTVSKSDLLKTAQINGKNVFTDEAAIFKNVNYPMANPGYMPAEGNHIEGLVRELIDPTMLGQSISRLYENVHYFAVSALGASPNKNEETGKKLVPKGTCTRLEEPIFWMLADLGIIPTVGE